MTDPTPISNTGRPGRGSAKRQTQSYLMETFAALGLRAKREFGQNFLIDLNLLDLLLRSARLTKGDVVLEVGAGTGGLTSRLAEEAGEVVSIEIDPGFYRLAAVEVENASNVTLINTDVLAGKNKLEPAVMEAVSAAMQRIGADHYHLVANLPYDVASSVVANCLLGNLPVRGLTFTVQYEVGLRISAMPGDRDYGPLSVLSRTLGDVRLIRTLPPSAFWPRPKVDSAFVRIEVDPERKKSLPDLREYHAFVRMIFIHRRKNLRGSILSVPDYKPLKGTIDTLLADVGLTRDDRAERLDPDRLLALYRRLAQAMKPSPKSGGESPCG